MVDPDRQLNRPKRAILRYRNGTSQPIELPYEREFQWPHELTHEQWAITDFTEHGDEIYIDPRHVTRTYVYFDIDRATFDPERNWQNYQEREP